MFQYLRNRYKSLKEAANKPMKEYKCSICDESYVFHFDMPPHKCDQYFITKKAVREVLEEMGFSKDITMPNGHDCECQCDECIDERTWDLSL